MWRRFARSAYGIVFVRCASATEHMQSETVRKIGGVNLDNGTVSNSDHGVTSTRRDGNTPKGRDSWSADDMMRKVNGVKR